MESIWFLDLDRALRTHRSLIEAYGGDEGWRMPPRVRWCGKAIARQMGPQALRMNLSEHACEQREA